MGRKKYYKRWGRKKYYRPKKNPLTRKIKLVLRRSIETKFVVTQNLFNNIDNTGFVVKLNDIPKGTGQAERIGNELRMMSLFIQGYWVTDLVNSTLCRLIIFQYRSQTATTIPTTNIVDNAGNPRVVASNYNIPNKDNYHILYDKMSMLAANSGTTIGELPAITPVGGNMYAPFRKFINLKYMVSEFDNGTPPYNTKGYIGALFLSGAPAAVPGLCPNIYFNCVLKYKDA